MSNQSRIYMAVSILMKFGVLVYDHESKFRSSIFDPTMIPDVLPGVITPLLGDLQM